MESIIQTLAKRKSDRFWIPIFTLDKLNDDDIIEFPGGERFLKSSEKLDIKEREISIEELKKESKE